MSELKKSFFGGIYYTALAKYAGILINLIVSGILSRLLMPKEFGIVAISMVFIVFFTVISDIGIGPAIIQRKDLTEDDIKSIFTLTLYAAMLISVIFFYSAGFIQEYYSTPVLKSICHILSLGLFFSILSIVPKNLLLKKKRFKLIGLSTLAIQVVGGTIAVLMAKNGVGIYSLLITPLSASVLSFFVYYFVCRIPISLRFRLSPFKKIFSYSIFQFFFTLINYFSRNLDNLLIGKFLGMDLLGYYEKSYRLMMLPLSNITNVLTPVMHPIFSEYQKDIPKLLTLYIKILKYLSFVGLPLSAFLFFDSRELIFLVFGGQWGKSVPVFQILSISVGFQIIVASAGSIFQATNNTRLLFIDGALSAVLVISGLLVGVFVFRDLKAIAIFLTVSFTINFFKSFYILFKFGLNGNYFHFLSQLIIPGLTAIVVGIILYFFNHLMIHILLLSLSFKCLIYFSVLFSVGLLFRDYKLSFIIKYALYRK